MAESKVVTSGDAGSLEFQLEWETANAAGMADEATRGRLLAVVGGVPVWFEEEPAGAVGVSWSLVELLEHLAWAWPYLQFEECDPFGICAEPDQVRAIAESRWQEMPVAERSTEQKQLRAFEESHDLARAFQGLWLPPLHVLRVGHLCWLMSDRTRHLAPHSEVMAAVEGVGDAVASRVRGLEDARSRSAVAAWDAKARMSAEQVLSAATGLEARALEQIAGRRPMGEFFEVGDAAPMGELVAVARMAAHALSPASARRLLDHVRRLEPVAGARVRRLDALSAEAAGVLGQIAGERAYDQGCQLAGWYRSRNRGRGAGKPVQPDLELTAAGVKVEQVDIESAELDAVSVWGKRRGPVVMLNRRGRHARDQAGRNATLAHELCHLIIDRGGALPFAEVMGGRLSRFVEVRARAFAAELLVPRDVAGAAFAGTASVASARGVMAGLRRTYRASKEIVAWQARNSGVALQPAVLAYLRAQVTHPERF